MVDINAYPLHNYTTITHDGRRPEFTSCKAGADAVYLKHVRNNNYDAAEMHMSKAQILADLKTRGFTPSQIKKCGYTIRDAKYTKSKTGFEVPSLEFPYRDISGKVIKGASRFKLYWTEEEKKAWKKGKPPKYVSIAGEAPHLYYSNLLHKEFGKYTDVAKDTSIPVLITEGEFKTDVGCEYGYCVIGIAGVWSWKSKNKKLPVIPDLKEINWDGREVYLTFDADLKTNVQVRKALNALADWLTSQGSMVYIAFLPELPDTPNTGLDDLLRAKENALDEIIENELQPYNYCEEMLNLNNEVGSVRNPGLIVELETGQLMKESLFKNLIYANRHYWVDTAKGMTKRPAANDWLKFPQRTEFRELTYRPGEDKITPDMCYNTWNSWGLEPKRGAIKPFKDLLKRWFGDDVENQNWFEQWLAYPLQHPGTKLAQAVVISSHEQGTGKTLLGYAMGRIYGKDNYTEITSADLTGNFNDWQKNKSFIMGSEIAGEDRKTYQNKIKNLVTQERARINPKGIPAYDLPDCINYYLTTNHCNALYLEDADRRFFVHQFRDRSNQNQRYEWFKEHFIPWYQNDGPAYLFYYLLNLDLTGFNPFGPAPMTHSKKEMIEDTKGELAQWCLELHDDPDSLLLTDGKPLKGDIFTLQQIKNLSGFGDEYSNTRWGISLKERGFYKEKIKVGTRSHVVYILRNEAKWLELMEKKKKNKHALLRDHWVNNYPELANDEKKY